MSRGYKYKEVPVKRLSVHLDEDEEYHEKVEELAHVIVAIDENKATNGNINKVLARMAQRYGLMRYQFTFWKVSERSFFIKLPLVLDSKEVIEDMTMWGLMHRWWFVHYDQNAEKHNYCMKFKVQIRMFDFPFQCWSKNKVIRAISPIGYIQYLNEENIEGTDRRFIEMEILCDDPRNIPNYLDVFYGKTKWRQCRIIVLDWDFDTWGPVTVRDGEIDKHMDGWSSEDDDEQDQQNINTRGELVNGHDRLQNYYSSRKPPSNGSSQPSDSIYNTFLTKKISDKENGDRGKEEELYLGPQRPGAEKWALRKGVELSQKLKMCSVERHSELGLMDQINLGPQQQSYGKENEENKGCTKRICNWSKVANYLNLHMKDKNEVNKLLNWSLRVEKEMDGRLLKEICINHEGNFVDCCTDDNLLSRKSNECMMTKGYGNSLGKVKRSSQKHCLGGKREMETLYKIKKSDLSVYTKDIYKENPITTHCPTIKFLTKMEKNYEKEEEELIKRLLEQTKLGGEQEHVIKIPTQAVVARNWRRCILVKVITDGRVTEENFSMTMRAAWRVHQDTKIEERKEKEFLVEFMCERDLSKVLDGWWHFKGDLVAMKRIFSQQEAEETEVDTIDLWVQAHGFPMGLILPNAIPDIMRVVGTPISDPQVIYNNGVKAYKIKLMVSLKKPVLHTLSLENEVIGKYKVYLVYDKVKKICLYCGIIGHVKEQCVDRRMYLRMKESEKFKGMMELWNMPEANFKPWIIDQTKVPIIRSSTKNALDSMGRGGENSGEGFDGGRDKQKIHEDWSKSEEEQARQMRYLSQENFLNKGGMKRAAGDMTQSQNIQNQMMIYVGSLEEEKDNQPLNRKRAREANPNSPPPSQ